MTSYSHSEILQAITAALLFGRDGIGSAARDQQDTDLELRHLTVCVDQGARDLLREAQAMVDAHGMALGMYKDLPLTRHDLRRAIPNHETTH
jgi:hypothetical protein